MKGKGDVVGNVQDAANTNTGKAQTGEGHDAYSRDEERRVYTRLLVAMIVGAVAGAAVAKVWLKTTWWGVARWGLLAGYLPSFLDMSHTRIGRKSRAVQHWAIWKRLVGYFDGRVITMAPLNPQQQYIFGVHPHGIGTWNHFLTMTNGCRFLSDQFPGERRDLAATILFYIPLVRELLLALGCVDAGAKTAHGVLKRGWSTLIFIGGEKEQILTQPGKHVAVIKDRKGFCRLALQYGCHLVPAYAWGENNLFHTFHYGKEFQLWLASTLRIACPPAFGRWFLPLVPINRQLTVVMAAPIEVQRVEKPTREQVQELHGRYVAALRALFDATKAKYGGPEGHGAVLEIR